MSTSTVGALIEDTTSGGFIAIASTGQIDRDGERIQPGCFAPLPATIPIHLDHTMSAASVVARGRPYYSGDRLMVEATFASTPDAQIVRAKVKDGTLDSLSIVFRGFQWEVIEGVRTCVRGELLAADVVSVPSNTGALILTSRSMRFLASEHLRGAIADGLLTLARAEIADCKTLGIGVEQRGRHRRRIDDQIRNTLNPDAPSTTTARQFLRSL